MKRLTAVFLAALALAFASTPALAADKTPLANYGGGAIPLKAGDTVPVANGGTSSTSLSSHCVLLGAGTSAPHTACPSTSGNVLTDNGGSVDPTFQAPTGGAVTNSASESVLGSTFSVPGTPTTWFDVTGISLSLGAGTYLLTANINFSTTATSTFSAKIYNSTDNADLVATSQSISSGFTGAMALSRTVTIAGAKTFKMAVQYNNAGSWNVFAGTTSATLLTAVRLY